MSRTRVIFIGLFAIGCAVIGGSFFPQLLVQIAKLTAGNRAVDYTQYPGLITPAMALLGFLLGVGLGRLILQVFEKGINAWEKMAIGDKVDIFIGIFAGIIASVPFYTPLSTNNGIVGPIITLALMVGFSGIAIYGLKSVSEVLPWHKNAGTIRTTGVKILDTNVLIDGRLYDIVRTGFLDGQMYVPQFVLSELQHIADSSDSLRRQRGRRGLEVLRHLQSDFNVQVGIYDKFAGDDREEVDARLVRLAKAIGGDLISNDFNLNRVARVQDVAVLNVNDLALALRPTVLPGEVLNLLLNREGNQYNQAVGYLDDGTMVVVENAKHLIGQPTDVIVTQVIQTERGKMIFASLDGLEPQHPQGRRGR